MYLEDANVCVGPIILTLSYVEYIWKMKVCVYYFDTKRFALCYHQ